ncbi:hypothetical protein LEN26_017036 [Aphanomyces euteiches]|nr:hypothetical protein LEN26_017035 [Aphanomyces euteiches]KAH9097408.1 hypothetical protein LEN26_017036 [Aphanomyces euteiches]
MASIRDVWYVLVDGQGKLSSKADKVVILSDSHVAQFRDAVHANNPRKLSQFDASDLYVYANKAAYDRKEQPLGCRVKIGQLLGSEDALFAVPFIGNVNRVHIVEAFDGEWLDDILTCSELPDVSHLVEKVSGSLPVRIPVANLAGLFAHVSVFDRPPVESIHNVFEENSAKHCPLVMQHIQRVMFDKVVWSPRRKNLLLFSRQGCYTWDRSSNKATSTWSYSPDFVFRLRNVCVFRGEEKKAGYDDPDVPRQELIDQLEWSYGSAPYLFGYSVCGFDLYLHAILPPSKEIDQDRPCKKPKRPKCSTFELGLFNLRTIDGRLDLFRSLVHISPYLVLVSNLRPRRYRPEFVCTEETRIEFEEEDDGIGIVKKSAETLTE